MNIFVSFPSRLHGINNFLELMRSRYQPTSQEMPFHLEQLEEDLVVTFIVGKPHIESPLLLRTVFKFKKDPKQELGTSQE